MSRWFRIGLFATVTLAVLYGYHAGFTLGDLPTLAPSTAPDLRQSHSPAAAPKSNDTTPAGRADLDDLFRHGGRHYELLPPSQQRHFRRLETVSRRVDRHLQQLNDATAPLRRAMGADTNARPQHEPPKSRAYGPETIQTASGSVDGRITVTRSWQRR